MTLLVIIAVAWIAVSVAVASGSSLLLRVAARADEESIRMAHGLGLIAVASRHGERVAERPVSAATRGLVLVPGPSLRDPFA